MSKKSKRKREARAHTREHETAHERMMRTVCESGDCEESQYEMIAGSIGGVTYRTVLGRICAFEEPKEVT